MKPSLKQIEAEAKVIRSELCSRYKLKKQQVAALPTIDKLSELAQIANYEILPLFWESIMTKEDREWMEKDKSSQSLEDILKKWGRRAKFILTKRKAISSISLVN